MTVASLRRLPGFRFEDRAPSRDVLPRMDVALFAGLPREGRSTGRSRSRMSVTSRPSLADWPHSPSTSTAARRYTPSSHPPFACFFANGGRRCWVIRLAQAAKSNSFRVPGLLAPFALQARSPGSWADDVAVSASLTSERRARGRGSLQQASLKCSTPGLLRSHREIYCV
jgi:hypothetical protein